MKKLFSLGSTIFYSLVIATLLGFFGYVAAANASLWAYYNEKGQSLPSVETRANIAEECGIEEYKGSFSQNQQLEACLRDVDYWVLRIQHNDIDPLTDEELEQVPERAWKLTVPRLIQVVQGTEEEQLGGAEPVVQREFLCRGDECDQYIGDEDSLGFTVVTRYKTTLSSSMTSNQTTVPVSSLATFDGHTLVTADISPAAFLTIEPGASREEIVKCTAISSPNWDPCTRGLAFYGTSEASVAANKKAHNAGSIVVMSNVHYVYEQLTDIDSTENISGLKTFTTGTIRIGDGTTAKNKIVYANNGDANLPFLRYNESTNKWQFSDDGTNTVNLETGGSGLSASTTKGIFITDSQIGVNASTTQGLQFNSDGTLGVKVNASSLYVDSNGVGINGAAPFITWSGQHTFSATTTMATTTINNLQLPTVTSTGSIIYYDGSVLRSLQIGTPGQGLKVNSGGTAPTWGSALEKFSLNEEAVTVSNTTMETNLFSTSVSGGTLRTANAIVVRIPISAFGIDENGRTATFKLKYGATTLATVSFTNPGGAGENFPNSQGDIEAILFADGATNAQKGKLSVKLWGAGIVNGPMTGTQETSQAIGFNTGTSVEDSTGALDLKVTVQFNVADADSNITANGIYAYILR